MRDVSVGQGRQVQIPAQLPMPIHDTDGILLPALVRNKLPVGTVAVRKDEHRFHAINAAGKVLRLPSEDADLNYMPTFDNIQPTHDMFGNRLRNDIIQILPFGSYNILVYMSPRFSYVAYCDINGINQLIAM